MKNYAEIMKIIDGGLKNDPKKVYDYSLLLAEKLRSTGEEIKAERILKLLSSQIAFQDNQIIGSARYSKQARQLPFDQESKLEIADYYEPYQIENKPLILSKSNQQQIDDFTKSYVYSDKLASHGLDVATTLLLFGPPGCGKTKTAFYVAQTLSLPLVIARLDTLISSYLGSTSKNIRLLFEYASQTPCILFLDEFDAVAKLRDDQHEMGELKRVVNSLLQNIDNLGDKCILIGATNHDKLLDKAIWRRFATRVHIKLPTEDMIKTVLKQYSADLNVFFEGKQIDLLAELFVGQSISDIEQITKKGIRKSIIEDREMQLADIVESYFSFIQMDFEVGDIDESRRGKIKYLMEKLNKPSRRTIGELLRCHHNTVSSDMEKIQTNER
ncbi:AAA family ATPase [Paenibacillus durus]|nr:AAA family ATPase [Paenibacillus durus]